MYYTRSPFRFSFFTVHKAPRILPSLYSMHSSSSSMYFGVLAFDFWLNFYRKIKMFKWALLPYTLDDYCEHIYMKYFYILYSYKNIYCIQNILSFSS